MSTLEEKIAALEANIEGYNSELAAAPAREKAVWAAATTETRKTLNKLLDAQNAAASTAASTEVQGKHLLPSLWPLFILCAIILTVCAEHCVPNFIAPLVFNETNAIVSNYGYIFLQLRARP